MMQTQKVMQEKILGSNPRIEISGVKIDVLDEAQTLRLVQQYIITRTPLHLMGVNADKLNAAAADPLLLQIINSCGVINADGASLIMASRYLGKPLPERVAGIDLMMKLVAMSEQEHYRVYLLGARQEVVEETAARLRQQFPKLELAGFRNGYFRDEDWPSMSAELKRLQPDLIFIGITSPLKEHLIEYFQNDGCAGVFMGVGGSFDVISGRIPRAPLWMQKWGLEWLFRVMQEPKRLFKRYFVGNFQFIHRIIKEKRTK